MKKLLCICIFSSLFFVIEAQDTLTFYLNSRYKILKDQNQATIKRKVIQSNNLWLVWDYLMNGTLKMTGSFLDSKFTRKQGIFKNYYESGKIKSIEQYNDNKKNGKWSQFYENGQTDYEIEYLNDTKSGVWNWYFENGQIGAKENYRNNLLLKAKYWNKDGKRMADSLAVYAPGFEGGGQDKFKDWVTERAKYPKDMAYSDIKGIVKIRFTINDKGEIEDIIIINNVYSRIDDVVVRVIKMAPKWTPGKMHNRYFPYEYEISVPMEYKK